MPRRTRSKRFRAWVLVLWVGLGAGGGWTRGTPQEDLEASWNELRQRPPEAAWQTELDAARRLWRSLETGERPRIQERFLMQWLSSSEGESAPELMPFRQALLRLALAHSRGRTPYLLPAVQPDLSPTEFQRRFDQARVEGVGRLQRRLLGIFYVLGLLGLLLAWLLGARLPERIGAARDKLLAGLGHPLGTLFLLGMVWFLPRLPGLMLFSVAVAWIAWRARSQLDPPEAAAATPDEPSAESQVSDPAQLSASAPLALPPGASPAAPLPSPEPPEFFLVWRAWDEALTTKFHPAKNLLAEFERSQDPGEALEWLQEPEQREVLERSRDLLTSSRLVAAFGFPRSQDVLYALKAYLAAPSPETLRNLWEIWLPFSRAVARALDRGRVRVGDALRTASKAVSRPQFEVREETWQTRSLLSEKAAECQEDLESIFRDLLTNSRDAGAKAVSVELLRLEDGGLQVVLRDDGAGTQAVDPSATLQPNSKGMSLAAGLSGARRWVESRAGTLEARGCAGGGFEVRIRLPAELSG